jgi:hypothetical protein
MGKNNRKARQLNGTYKGTHTYHCDICDDDIVVQGASIADIKAMHVLECHYAEPVALAPKPVVVVAKPKRVRKPVTKPAVTTVKDITARMQRLEELLTSKAEKSLAKAKDESTNYLDIKALEAEIVKLETKVLPMLMGVPEAYRDSKAIDLCNKELAAAKSDLATCMLNPSYTRAEQAHDALVREERIQTATNAVARDNAAACDVTSPIGEAWMKDETERFNSMLNGDIWIPRPKRDPKRIPFGQDLWWALQTHAKYGITDSVGSYIRPPIAGKDRKWEYLQPIVAEVFDELMLKYSFDFSTKKYDMRASLKQVDSDGFIIDNGSKVITKTYALPHDEWLERVSSLMYKVWKKTWNRRDVEIPKALAELGYYGTGKEDLGREYCSWAGNVPVKVQLGNMSNMQYAMLEAQGKLPKDTEVPQTKATSRKRGK